MDERRLYWWVSVFLLSLCALSLVMLGLELVPYSSPLRRRFYFPFYFVVLGDIVFVFLTYLPNHIYNLIRSGYDPTYQVDENCDAISFMTGLATSLNALGMANVWVMTWAQLRFGPIQRRWLATVVYMSVVLTMTLVWWLTTKLTGKIGSFEGLFCAANDFTGPPAIVFVASANLCSGVAGVFLFKTLRIVNRKRIGESATMDNEHTRKRAKAVDKLNRLAKWLTLCFLINYLPLFTYITLRLFRVVPPRSFMLFSLWAIKIKPILDSWTLISAVREEKDTLGNTFNSSKVSPANIGSLRPHGGMIAEKLRRSSSRWFPNRRKSLALEEKYEHVPLSEKERVEAKKQIAFRVGLLLVEVADFSVDAFNFFVWMRSAPSFDVYGTIFSSTMMCVFGLSAVAAGTLFRQIRTIRNEIMIGIRVKASKARAYRIARQEQESEKNGKQEVVEAQKQIIEFKLSRLARIMVNIRFIVIAAILEDFLVFFLTFWRIGFTGSLLDKEFGECLVQRQDNSAPTACVDSTLSAAMLQLLLSGMVFTYKISFMREYFNAKSEIKELTNNLKLQEKEESSVLDSFGRGQVHEAEIAQVVSIRKHIQSATNGKCENDLRLLHFFRKANQERLLATKMAHEWMQKRSQAKWESIRYKLISGNLSWSSMPGMSFLDDMFSFRCWAKEMQTRDESILWVYISLERFEVRRLLNNMLGEAPLSQALVFLMERILLWQEDFSVANGVVSKVYVICDGRSLNEEAEPSRAKYAGLLADLWQTMMLFPIDMQIFLWRPCELLETINKNCNLHLPVVDVHDCIKGRGIFRKMPTNVKRFLESRLSRLSDEQSSNSDDSSITAEKKIGSFCRPREMDEQEFMCDSLSRTIASDLQAFPEVYMFQQNNLLQIRRMLALQRKLKAYENEVRTAIEVEGQTLDSFLETISELLVVHNTLTQGESFESLRAKYSIAQFVVLHQGRIENLPRSVYGYVNLLRLLDKSRGSIENAAFRFATLVLWREKNGLNTLNKRITTEDMSISTLEHFQALSQVLPMNPLTGYDPETSTMVAVVQNQPICFSRDSENYLMGIREMVEYCFILCDELSRRNGKLVKLSVVTLDSVSQALFQTSNAWQRTLFGVLDSYPSLCVEPWRSFVSLPGWLLPMVQSKVRKGVPLHFETYEKAENVRQLLIAANSIQLDETVQGESFSIISGGSNLSRPLSRLVISWDISNV